MRKLGVLALCTLITSCASTKMGSMVDIDPVEWPEPPAAVPNGAIYQPERSYIALFEDRRPRAIGDTITIRIDESIDARKNASTSTSRTASIGATFDDLSEALEVLEDYGFDMSSNSEFEGSGSSRANGQVEGTITAQVTRIHPAGQLEILGEKRLKLNRGTEYIRISGIIHPRDIDGNNSVLSTAVARAKIEYVGTGEIADANRMGFVQRLWLWLSPF